MNRTCALLLLMFVVGVQGQAGDKPSPWKAMLPDDIYKELTARSIKTIEDAAKADLGTTIEAEAAILAGYTLSVKNANDDAVVTLRASALRAGQLVHDKKSLKPLVAFGAMVKTAKEGNKELKIHLHDVDDLMAIFRGKAKGGEGIHADLQYQPKLKNLNGIEALIGALATKKLSDANLDKVSKELVPLSYRIAVVGAVTHEVTPGKDAGKWRILATQMRDASLALADAARKKDGDGIMKTALALETTCTACHMGFKK